MERKHLLNIVKRYKNIIDNKKTDFVSVQKFNATSRIKRTVDGDPQIKNISIDDLLMAIVSPNTVKNWSD